MEIKVFERVFNKRKKKKRGYRNRFKQRKHKYQHLLCHALPALSQSLNYYEVGEGDDDSEKINDECESSKTKKDKPFGNCSMKHILFCPLSFSF